MARKILVVDDDPNALRLVSYAFLAEGYETVTANSGAEALARLASEQPDLIVLDVMMPDMSGLELCQRIRANRQTSRLPILMLSARGLVADRVAGLKAGADDYLPKPADTSELIARAEALLTRASYAAPPVAQVLAFFGVKGGVGTTTVAVNLGAQLAQPGKSVCLVELRPGIGTAPALLGLQPAHQLGELLQKPPEQLGQRDVEACLLAHSSGLRLLAAPQSADKPYEITSEFVEALVRHLSRMMDYVLFDLPAGWSAANWAAVRQARLTALVCEPDPLSLECVRATLATLHNWGVSGDLVGLIPVNRGNNPSPMTIPALQAAIRAGVIGALPPAGDVLRIAAGKGMPLAAVQAQHPAAVALRELAGRLTGLHQNRGLPHSQSKSASQGAVSPGAPR